MKFTTPKSAVLAFALCFAANGAFAGVADKKAKRAADEAVTKSTASTVKACGNKEFKVNIVWADYDKFVADAKNLKEITDNRGKTADVYNMAGRRAKAVLEALTKICADKDYKEEVAKLKVLKITPQAGFKSGKTAFTKSKDNAELSVAAGHYYSRSASDFMGTIKKLY